ncbi:exodeoxyribonuclease VII small subunit [Wansuia hejianensis]|uniref:Exodeoxyribonuclease 7 small subunit n=1 Tax=Wansuia hejianensis TaxID=2763667 RepID=A0A926EVD4_9FIRM|nr:exodeoxyribonuclease VII small subunit [Wansuia hejianensis]MBC8590568.1 exodeoxyribonuclease VII small subunit [Wansuia hejianensis]
MDINKLSYEEAIKKLEIILEELENEDLSLDKSIEKFKQGIELYKYCNSIISKTEGDIKILLDNEDNSLEEIDFFREAEDD